MKEINNAYGFIYITQNLINGKKYIGQRKFSKGHGGWQNYLGSGILFQKALKKYGRENFKRNIVDIAYSKDELNLKEFQWIKNYNATNSEDFYNIAEGGNDGSRIAGKTKEEIDIYKKKQSESHKGLRVGKENPFFGKHHSEESKKKISQNRKGLLTGEDNPMYGKKHSEETKRKMLELRKVSNSRKISKPVIQLDLNGFFISEFSSGKEASEQLNIDPSHISKCCRGKSRHKTIGGYKWMFKTEYENLYSLSSTKGGDG